MVTLYIRAYYYHNNPEKNTLTRPWMSDYLKKYIYYTIQTHLPDIISIKIQQTQRTL